MNQLRKETVSAWIPIYLITAVPGGNSARVRAQRPGFCNACDTTGYPMTIRLYVPSPDGPDQLDFEWFGGRMNRSNTQPWVRKGISCLDMFGGRDYYHWNFIQISYLCVKTLKASIQSWPRTMVWRSIQDETWCSFSSTHLGTEKQLPLWMSPEGHRWSAVPVNSIIKRHLLHRQMGTLP